jgi:hypothetical protein
MFLLLSACDPGSSASDVDAKRPAVRPGVRLEDAQIPGAVDVGASIPDATTVPPDETTSPDGAVNVPDAAGPGLPAANVDAGAVPSTDAALAAPAGPPAFRRFTVDAAAAGPAYVEIVDLDGDGTPELVASHLGVFLGFALPEGELTVYRRASGDPLDRWHKETIAGPGDGLRFPGQVKAADIDGDGAPDLVVPSGFFVCQVVPGGSPCGGLGWYRQSRDGWVRRDIVPVGAALFYHGVEWTDFDGDGLRDLVTVGEEKQAGFGETPERAEVQWFRGTDGVERFDPTPRRIGAGLGSFPVVRDLDGDGDLDVAGAEFFDSDASFAWFERTAEPSAAEPGGRFIRHVIDAGSGPSLMLRLVDDLYGDGRTIAVGTNHVNTAKVPPDPWHEGVFAFEPNDDPRQPWRKTVLSEAFTSAVNLFAPQAAPGIFDAGDIDGDGDLDLLVAGDGDPRVLWFEQRSPGAFVPHVLTEGLGQAGGARIADLDGDGRAELVVTGYEANAIYVFSRI